MSTVVECDLRRQCDGTAGQEHIDRVAEVGNRIDIAVHAGPLDDVSTESQGGQVGPVPAQQAGDGVLAADLATAACRPGRSPLDSIREWGDGLVVFADDRYSRL